MKERTYAREITKEYLKKLGITYVSPDGNIIQKGDKTLSFYFDKTIRRPYFKVQFYDHEARFSVPKEERTNSTGQFQLGVHVVNYVWNVGDKPEGYVVDHIDNDSTNNDIKNLQLLSPRENLAKERTSDRVVKMPKRITEAEIIRKLEGYEAAYEQAKANHDAEAAHKLRSSLSLWRAKYRQFLEDPEKYAGETVEHECHARAAKRRELQQQVAEARKLFQEARDAFGADDPTTKRYKESWKAAIAEDRKFCEENYKKSKKTIS